MRHLIVGPDNSVVNVIEWDEGNAWSAPPGCTVIASDIGNIGDSFDGTTFAPPASEAEPLRGSCAEASSSIACTRRES